VSLPLNRDISGAEGATHMADWSSISAACADLATSAQGEPE